MTLIIALIRVGRCNRCGNHCNTWGISLPASTAGWPPNVSPRVNRISEIGTALAGLDPADYAETGAGPAQVAVVPSRGGADIGLRLSDPVGPKSCELVVISKAGDRQTAMTWSVPARGYGAGVSAPLLTRGQAGFDPDQIAQFEIHSGGRTLLVIPT
jgi:hypothetical protein